MRAAVLVSSLFACSPPSGGSPASPPSPAAPKVAAGRTSAADPSPAVATPSPARRCLPVVAAECGCVYSCGLGTEDAPGRWSVAHEHWAPDPIVARVDRWCAEGQCTEAFFGEIVCGGICSPRPAEPNCRLVGDRCEVAPSAVATPAPTGEPAALRSIAAWPFSAWDRAEAITYNHVPHGPGVPLRVYDAAHGWSPKIVERKPITAAQAERAVGWVVATGGEVEVSKCAFPRHAVVLYAGQTPVGTANVCFECGDILVWPDLDRPPDYDDESAAAAKRRERTYKQKLTAYKKVFPQWERFFRDELGFSLTPPQRP